MADPVYAGLSRVRLKEDLFDFGHGVRLRSIYAHLFAAPMIAFQRAKPGEPHPSPWRAADGGGYAHDMEVELSVDGSSELPGNLSAERTIALLASLLRLQTLSLTVPILSDIPIDSASNSLRGATLRAFETGKHLISYHNPDDETIAQDQLIWVRDRWPVAARLVKSSPAFEIALSALDECMVEGRAGSSLMLAWGALEGLFAQSSRSETTHRVSAFIAAYNCPPGPARLELFQRTKKLYAARSKVAHTSADSDASDLLETFIILRQSVIRILDRGDAPTPALLEKILFGVTIDADHGG